MIWVLEQEDAFVFSLLERRHFSDDDSNGDGNGNGDVDEDEVNILHREGDNGGKWRRETIECESAWITSSSHHCAVSNSKNFRSNIVASFIVVV